MLWKPFFALIAALEFWMLFFGLRCGVLPTYVSTPVTRKRERKAFALTAVIYAAVGLSALVVLAVI